MSHRYQGVLCAGLALLAMLGIAGIAAAFNPPEQSVNLEIPLRQFQLDRYDSPAMAVARDEASSSFQRMNGGDWSVFSWNPQTNTAHAFIGSGLQVSRSFVTEDDAVEAARQIVRENPAVFGADVNQLRVTKSPVGYGKRSVHFQQTYQGLDVIGGTAHLVFTEGGRLFKMGSDYYPGISVNPTPSIPASVAGEIALRDLAASNGVLMDEAPELLILPVPVSETSVDYRLVWRVKVRTEEPLGIWVTHVDAHRGEIVWRYNHICFVDFQGTTSGQIQRYSYCDGVGPEPMPYLRVTVSGQAAVYANGNGNWTVPYAGTDARAVTADLYSPYVDLNNIAGAEAAFNGTATPGVPIDIAFTTTNAQNDEMDVYRAVNDIHDFYQSVHPAYGYANTRMTANVSRGSTCNAYWDGTINFYIEGGGCANTGEIMGVVHHEFCHGITDDLIGSQGSNGIGEGNSDVLSNYMTGDPIIGRGFYLNNCTSGIRTSDNTLQYPADLNGSIHHDGQIIAGFHWDSWQELQATLTPAEAFDVATNTWHWGRVHSAPGTQPDQVLATFVADDDDGDLTNGTPHHAAFCVGASNHSFACPAILVGVFITHEPLGSRTTPGDATVVATITSTEGTLVPSALRLDYRIGGGAFVSVPLTSTGQPSQYSAVIPGLSLGSEVEYYLSAADDQGNTKTSPVDAPTALWAFDVCNVLDQLEAESGWTVNAEGTDNATGGQWVRVDPIGTTYNSAQIQPEDDRTPAPGVTCWITGQHVAGQSAGYADVDGGTTTLYSPVYDLTGSSVAKVKYYRWYSDDRGLNAGDDTWTVQVRNNGGAWQNVESTTAEENFWKQISFDLYAAFGAGLGQVQFKFIATDTGANSLCEAAVDELEILNLASENVGDWSGATARFALLGSRPNPARAGSEIAFQVPARATVRLTVYDVSGRQVKSLANGTFDAGVHVTSWDGRDAQGRAAASGIYYLKMQTEEFTSTRTMVLTR